MGLNDYLSHVQRFQSFITNDERDTLYNFAMDQYSKGMFRWDRIRLTVEKSEQAKEAVKSKLRWSLSLNHIDVYNSEPLLHKLRLRIEDTLNLQQYKKYVVDPLYGFVANIVLPGGFIQIHKDTYENENFSESFENYRHIRFNIMVNRTNHKCYDPHFIHNKIKMIVPIRMGDAWCFPADTILHYMPFIEDSEPRIVYQFGFAVDVG